ncbi:MAG: hypothetical protein B6U89_06380 [Desulfurococcales archaeon ex4484_58]|nr:MAG: hypothetical protein B6U89_06380 [Desulfurococcales archaeon ex4484_58]
MDEFILIALKRGGKQEYEKIVFTDNTIYINDKKYDIEDLLSIEGEIKDHIKIYEYKGEDNYIEHVLPVGYIRLKFKNNLEVTLETMNPLSKIEELVIKINSLYIDRGVSKLGLIESSIDRVVYVRSVQ